MIQISIMGKSFSFGGKGNVQINNGTVYIDGKKVDVDAAMAQQIVIHGNVGSIETDLSVNVNGTVEGSIKAGGSVNCDDVMGDVQAGGSVNCDDVGGGIVAKGSVNWDGK